MIGFGLSVTNHRLWENPVQAGEPFVAPQLVSYFSAYNNYSGWADMWFRDSLTSGTPCKIKFMIKSGKNAIVWPTTDNYENSPHTTSIVQVSNPLYRGIYWDLYWSWYCEGGQSLTNILHSVGSIYVPLVGDPSNP